MRISAPYVQRLNQAPPTSFFLLGPRGSGKTTWLRHVLPQALWLSLLNEERYQEYLVRPATFRQELRRWAANPNGNLWVVIDEVQRLPNLLNEVHAAIEAHGLHFALCGSSARKLRQSGVNLLAGRALPCAMYPFVPEELGAAFDLERALQFGTLPIVWHAVAPAATLQAYAHLYLKEEIQAEAAVRRVAGFARFLESAALFHGQTLEISSLARDVGMARSTVQDHLQILEDTLLATRLAPFASRLRVKQPQRSKLYFVDGGLPRAIKRTLAKPSAEEQGPLFEGLVLMILRAYREHRQLYETDSYWAADGSGNIEVDIVLQRQQELLGIEVKATTRLRQTHLKGLRALHAQRPLAKRLLVYRGNRSLRSEDGIDILSFADFCKLLAQGKL